MESVSVCVCVCVCVAHTRFVYKWTGSGVLVQLLICIIEKKVYITESNWTQVKSEALSWKTKIAFLHERFHLAWSVHPKLRPYNVYDGLKKKNTTTYMSADVYSYKSPIVDVDVWSNKAVPHLAKFSFTIRARNTWI